MPRKRPIFKPLRFHCLKCQPQRSFSTQGGLKKHDRATHRPTAVEAASQPRTTSGSRMDVDEDDEYFLYNEDLAHAGDEEDSEDERHIGYTAAHPILNGMSGLHCSKGLIIYHL